MPHLRSKPNFLYQFLSSRWSRQMPPSKLVHKAIKLLANFCLWSRDPARSPSSRSSPWYPLSPAPHTWCSSAHQSRSHFIPPLSESNPSAFLVDCRILLLFPDIQLSPQSSSSVFLVLVLTSHSPCVPVWLPVSLLLLLYNSFSLSIDPSTNSTQPESLTCKLFRQTKFDWIKP